MIREIIKPKQSHLVIDIPESYVDKEIELLIFPIEGSKKSQKDISSLAGSLHKYANPSKINMEDKAWELHIKSSFQYKIQKHKIHH